MADTAYNNPRMPVSAISLSIFHLPSSLFIAVTLLRNHSIAPNNRFFTFIINRYIVLYIISVSFCRYPLRFVSSFLRSSPLKGDSSCLIVSTLKTNWKHCPSLRGTSAVSRANGTEGVISKFSSSFSSSLFEELPQSYDAANSVCSEIDRLRKENNKQVIFSNVNDDDNDNDNINHAASIRPQRYNPTKAESIE
jgi:hypothetical protein